MLPASEALKAVAAFRLALPRTILQFAGGREITLGDLGAKQGILGGINAVIVGNYLTTLGPAEDDLDLLVDLSMPIKTLNDTLWWSLRTVGEAPAAATLEWRTWSTRHATGASVPSGPSAPPGSSTSRPARRAVPIRCLHRDRTGIAVTTRPARRPARSRTAAVLRPVRSPDGGAGAARRLVGAVLTTRLGRFDGNVSPMTAAVADAAARPQRRTGP